MSTQPLMLQQSVVLIECFLFILLHIYTVRVFHPRTGRFDQKFSKKFGFARAAFLFYYFSSHQVLGLFFINSNTLKSCLQLMFFVSLKDYISFRKIIFQFLLQTIYQGQIFQCANDDGRLCI